MMNEHRRFHCEKVGGCPDCMPDLPFTRPPNDRGQGRKPLPESERVIVRSIRLTPAQWQKLAQLGGAAWIRAQIDQA